MMMVVFAVPDAPTNKTGNIYGPPLGTNLVVFIDDMNMPKVDTYGTQQPITL
jgi:dynein heavy chain